MIIKDVVQKASLICCLVLKYKYRQVIFLKWEEVRKIYPDRYVLLQVLESHIEEDKKYIDDVAIIRAIDDSKEATHELVNGKPGTLVYHTAKDKIEVLIRKRVGFRRNM